MADRIEDLQKRLAKDPNSKVFAQLAEEFRRAGMLREAVATCRDGLSRHPTYFSARVALGRALLEYGSYDEARIELEKVLAQVPDNILAHKFLGETYQHLGKLAEAIAKYEMVQTLAPGDTEVADRIRELTEAIRNAPPAPRAPVIQDDQAMEFSDAAVTSSPSEEPSAQRVGGGAPTLREDASPPPERGFEIDDEVLFDARNPGAVEAEIVLEPEEKLITSVFERQAREMRHSEAISSDARVLQEQFESGPLTSSFQRQAREIRDAGVKPAAPSKAPPPAALPQDRYIEPEPMPERAEPIVPAHTAGPWAVRAISPAEELIIDPEDIAIVGESEPAPASTFPVQDRFLEEPLPEPQQSSEPATPPSASEFTPREEDFEVGELTSYFLGRTVPAEAEAAEALEAGTPSTYAPPPIPRLDSTFLVSPEPELATGFDVDRVPGTDSFSYLGEPSAQRVGGGAPTQQEESQPEAAAPAEPSRGDDLTSRALADLYFSQGHHDLALSIYQNLAAAQPGDTEIRRRIEEIQAGLSALASRTEAPRPLSPSPPLAPERPLHPRHEAAREAIRSLESWLDVVGALRRR